MSTNTQHTPAPWKMTPKEGYFVIHSENAANAIATVGSGVFKFTNEGEANARLITSAPELKAENEALTSSYGKVSRERESLRALNAELLEALKMVMASIHEYGSFSNSEEFFNCKNKALQAIAKAEGKER